MAVITTLFCFRVLGTVAIAKIQYFFMQGKTNMLPKAVVVKILSV